MDFALRLVCIPMQQNPNAPWQRIFDRNLIATQQRNFQPSQLACSQGGKLCGQVFCDGKNRAGDIGRFDFVATDHQRQQLTRREQDLVTIVTVDCCRTANTSANGHSKFTL